MLKVAIVVDGLFIYQYLGSIPKGADGLLMRHGPAGQIGIRGNLNELNQSACHLGDHAT